MASPGTTERIRAHCAQHPEQVFVAKAFLTIFAIIGLRNALAGWLPLLTLFAPIAFLVFVRAKAAAAGVEPNEMLSRYVTLAPVMYAEGENRRDGVAWATYALIAANLLVFYGFQREAPPRFLVAHLVFLPYEPNVWNVPVSAVSSLFLHGGPGHLWGNMLFLWAVGTVVERRIGWRPFLTAYLATGLAAALIGVGVPWIVADRVTHGLGASGAISGVLGVFAIRCYFKTMVFPLPILGIFSLILPLAVKVRINSLVLVGLFFFADLSRGIDQVTGAGFSPIGHWAHLGGMVAGIGLAAWLSLGSEAAQERHLDIGTAALEAGTGLRAGRESLRRVLEKDPENPEALLALARLQSRFQPSDEGRELYCRCIAALMGSDHERAAAVFEEYYALYPIGVEPHLQYRLASALARKGKLDLASRCLEQLVREPDAPAEIVEKALFQCAKIYSLMGLDEAARDAYRRFAEAYPDSAGAARARERGGVDSLRGKSPGSGRT